MASNTEPGHPKQRQLWLKRVLIPFWVFQTLFMLILIGINVWIKVGSFTQTLGISGILVMTFSCFNMLIIVAEIILFARRRLQPLAYLIFQVLKTTLWVALFVMSMVGVGRIARAGSFNVSVGMYLFTGLIEIVIVLLAFVGTLIYASVIHHRRRRNIPFHRSEWNPAADVDRYKGPYTESELGTIKYTGQPGNRDSTSAPEVDRGFSTRLVGELGGDAEIKEMDTEQGASGMELAVPDRRPRELQDDGWIYELSATGSVRGSRKVGELEGETPPRVPQKS